jgi:F-type H+-transporting ATPase subunit gamma
MSDSIASLKRQITSAGDLKGVVRAMKALAASRVGQYEASALALKDYYRTVELGLGACFRALGSTAPGVAENHPDGNGAIGAIVFGSDQGLVGQFNEALVAYTVATLATLPGGPKIWAVGERVQARLVDAGLRLEGRFELPQSVAGIAPLVAKIQLESEAYRAKKAYSAVYVFHNRPQSGAVYASVNQRLLPLDASWQLGLSRVPWPTPARPELLATGGQALRALIREYLFISIFRACAESLASENASRLAAMQRAEKNIDELVVSLNGRFHHLRQSGIDEELFDVVSGFEALGGDQSV